jgi:Rieske Fe-S protein
MCDGDCPLNGVDPRLSTLANPDRRQFITESLLAAVTALLVNACGDGEIGGVGPGGVTDVPPPVLDTRMTIRLADFPALQQIGGIARVDGNSSSPIAVARLSASTFVALSMICPHAGYKPINIQSAGFRCPNHGATFAADGHWTGGQRTKNLQAYPTSYSAATASVTIG